MVDLLERKVLSRDPEEHHAGQQRAKRTNVDGDDIHPLGGDLLDKNGNNAAHSENDRRCRDALELQVVLQRCDRSLIQVDNGAQAGKQDADEEDNADDTAAGHTVKNVDEPHEHEPRAAFLQRSAARRHRRDDDECRKESRERIEHGNVSRGGHDVLILRQIGAVDDRTVTGDGQREERLAEGENPHQRVEQPFGVEREDVLVAGAGAGKKRDINAENHKQDKQRRHHDLIGFFNAAGYAQRHDGKGSEDRNNDAGDVIHRDNVKVAADGRHVLSHCMHIAGDGDKGVLEDPAHDDRVTDREGHRADDRDKADAFADLAVAAESRAFAESADGAGAGRTAESKLADNAGRTNQENADEVRDKKRHSAPYRDHDGEAPDVAHADGGTDAGEDETPPAGKAVTV